MRSVLIGLLATTALSIGEPAAAQADRPWMDARKTPDQRADLLLLQLSQADKIALIQGEDFGATAGKLADLSKFGLPPLLEADSPLGITNLNRKVTGVTMPAAIATAASWNPALARRRGEVLAEEARGQGVGILLYPGGNLVRDPRGGRTGEYFGEDPLLSGLMMAGSVEGVQSRNVVATVKHLGVYGWESQRKTIDIRIDEAAARESDLLAFELAVGRSRPASVMCAYSWFNGVPSCASKFLMTDVLRRDWGFKGFVMADWDAFQDTVTTANAGLDIQSGILPTTNPKPGQDRKAFQGGGFNDGRQQVPPGPFGPGGQTRYYGQIQSAIDAGQVSQATLDAMARNILRGLFQVGVVDHPPGDGPVGSDAHRAVARAQVEEGAVLLKNAGAVLPLAPGVRVALIGSVSQPYGASKVVGPSLREALEIKHQGAVIVEAGQDEGAAARVAAEADVAIVSVRLSGYEGGDLKALSLPASVASLIRTTAAANPRTVVLVYGGNPIDMPWLDQVAGVLQVWDGGDEGALGVAHLLDGVVNPSGRLPLTYPASVSQLPHPEIPGFNRGGLGGIYPEVTQARMSEGGRVGYKWFEAQRERPLFPFGYGLSYTTFDYGPPTVETTKSGWWLSVRVTNTGTRRGKNVVQVYGAPPGGGKRLAGFEKVDLEPGASRVLKVPLEAKALASWSVEGRCWALVKGDYAFIVGTDAVTEQGRFVIRSPKPAVRREGGSPFCR